MRRLRMLPSLAVAALAIAAAGCGDGLLTPGPTEAAAQEAPSAREGDRMRGPGPRLRGRPGRVPLSRLLERREELGLTAEQVSRLEALATELEGQRETLRAQVEARVGELPDRPRRPRAERPQLTEEERAARREEMRARREALQPLMQEMRASRREAIDEVREILTDEQEAKLRVRKPAN